ncbi:hypothetical protein [Tahibacter harae]|uniref:Uncharacterized protein n=1 Tax=Tahibacter harae TaxID=2963937 RepID=A0ABT1QW52_9GAMM|nr:hypothetical protein [Tahibacter harae]MCQ4166519.1 hypothetical protein [Tahibacter harae]
MTDYTLTLQISSADLPTLQAAGQQIVLVRKLADAGQTVAWAVLPLALNRRVGWNDSYTLYASNTPNLIGNIIVVAAQAGATFQCDYSLSVSGFQGPVPDPALGPATVQIVNTVPAGSSASMLLGLAQCYGLDGGASGSVQPLNAQTVPAQQIARFSAAQQVWVYLASGCATGMIVPPPLSTTTASAKQVFSTALLLSFSAAAASQTALYSATLGRFYVPGATPAAESDATSQSRR